MPVNASAPSVTIANVRLKVSVARGEQTLFVQRTDSRRSTLLLVETSQDGVSVRDYSRLGRTLKKILCIAPLDGLTWLNL